MSDITCVQEADLAVKAAQLALDIAAGRKPRVRAMFKSDKLQNRDGTVLFTLRCTAQCRLLTFGHADIAAAVDMARKAAARQPDLPHVSAAVEAVALGVAAPNGIAGLRDVRSSSHAL